MKIPRFTVALNTGLFALLTWLYAGDLSDAVRGRSAEVAALTELPNLPFAAAALLATVGAALATGLGLLRRQPAGWRGYRLMPIVTVLVLFVDLLVLSSGRLPLGASERAVLALQVFEQRANALGSTAAVPDVRSLEPVLSELGPPPWLQRGVPVKQWALEARAGCSGPVTHAEGRAPGTLFYCVAAEGRQAWVTLVGLPREQRFGTAAVVSVGGEPLVVTVVAHPPDEPAGAVDGLLPEGVELDPAEGFDASR